MIIWEIIEYRKNLKNIEIPKSKKNGKKKTEELEQPKKLEPKYKWILIIEIMVALIIGAVFYDYNPVKSLENKSGLNYLSSYTYDSFIVFNRNIKYEDYSCLATFISVFPIGLFIGIWYIFKEENKHLSFIVPTVIVSIIELILIVSNIAIEFLPNYLIVLGFNLLQIYMIIYIFSRVEVKLFSLVKSAYIALIFSAVFLFMPKPLELSTIISDIAYMIFVLEAYLLLNYSDRRIWRLASWVFTLICLFEFIGYGIVKFV